MSARESDDSVPRAPVNQGASVSEHGAATTPAGAGAAAGQAYRERSPSIRQARGHIVPQPSGPADADGAPLVASMTRPTMIGGMTLASLAISLYLPVMAMMLTRSLWPALLAPPLLLASYLVCLKDVYLFDIALAAMHLQRCPNHALWGCRRYAPC